MVETTLDFGMLHAVECSTCFFFQCVVLSVIDRCLSCVVSMYSLLAHNARLEAAVGLVYSKPVEHAGSVSFNVIFLCFQSRIFVCRIVTVCPLCLIEIPDWKRICNDCAVSCTWVRCIHRRRTWPTCCKTFSVPLRAWRRWLASKGADRSESCGRRCR